MEKNQETETSSNNKNANDENDKIAKEETREIKSYLWWSVTGAISIGVLVIALMSIFEYSTMHEGVTAFCSGILIAGGSLLSGGFLGFIFGIPSILQDPEARLKYNDNLVQISDWLTKIIVGVGLTQLYRIPHFILNVGSHFEVNFGRDDWGRNVAIAIIAYFIVLGFLMIYFWTKTDYSTVMKFMDDDFNRKLREEKEAKQRAQQENKDMSIKIAEKETKERIDKSDKVSDSNSMSQLIEKSNEELNSNLNTLKALVEQILPTKKVKVKDDLQKQRWDKGSPQNNGKKISAKVTQDEWQSLFDVLITVSNEDDKPLTVPVAIFVHDSYKLPNDVVYVTPNDNGVAQLSLLAYEAFTMGALFADGTELELDLNEQSGYPGGFYVKKNSS